MKTIITGDLHGEFSDLNRLISRKRPELVLCCGDFGYFPNLYPKDMQSIKPQTSKVHFCDGNHEDHWALRKFIGPTEVVPNVFYMPRGSTYKLPDGRTILFMGGADSIDKNKRLIGVDWFPNEIIMQSDFQNLPDTEIDIFITHTCPRELVKSLRKKYPEKGYEPSNEALSQLWKIYKPKLWYFGHWHQFKYGLLGKTKWFCLSHPGQGEMWWIPLHK